MYQSHEFPNINSKFDNNSNIYIGGFSVASDNDTPEIIEAHTNVGELKEQLFREGGWGALVLDYEQIKALWARNLGHFRVPDSAQNMLQMILRAVQYMPPQRVFLAFGASDGSIEIKGEERGNWTTSLAVYCADILAKLTEWAQGPNRPQEILGKNLYKWEVPMFEFLALFGPTIVMGYGYKKKFTAPFDVFELFNNFATMPTGRISSDDDWIMNIPEIDETISELSV
ncbi:hypothetical protein BYT27DRAFT_7207449 [Phlegmacium glaucopus]|nr:hypothetical protein BYT27DRAFT_7207449 [Phlegmacium glaucopus]